MNFDMWFCDGPSRTFLLVLLSTFLCRQCRDNHKFSTVDTLFLQCRQWYINHVIFKDKIALIQKKSCNLLENCPILVLSQHRGLDSQQGSVIYDNNTNFYTYNFIQKRWFIPKGSFRVKWSRSHAGTVSDLANWKIPTRNVESMLKISQIWVCVRTNIGPMRSNGTEWPKSDTIFVNLIFVDMPTQHGSPCQFRRK